MINEYCQLATDNSSRHPNTPSAPSSLDAQSVLWAISKILFNSFIYFFVFYFESAFVFDANSFANIRQEGNVRLMANPHTHRQTKTDTYRDRDTWLTGLGLVTVLFVSLAQHSHYNAQHIQIDHCRDRAGVELQLRA